jgi:predicted Holliday junction resolvase-like endonuclease
MDAVDGFIEGWLISRLFFMIIIFAVLAIVWFVLRERKRSKEIRAWKRKVYARWQRIYKKKKTEKDTDFHGKKFKKLRDFAKKIRLPHWQQKPPSKQ